MSLFFATIRPSVCVSVPCPGPVPGSFPVSLVRQIKELQEAGQTGVVVVVNYSTPRLITLASMKSGTNNRLALRIIRSRLHLL